MKSIKEKNEEINILIVDDNSKNLQILGNLLKSLKYRVEFAIDGIEALRWLDRKKFDLVLLDIIMPRMDGFEVCKKIKANLETKDVPVIFITAKNDIKSTVKGFELGAIDYITKPFNISELRARVATQIELKRTHNSLDNYSKELEHKNKLIIDSIQYAQRIQNAILPAHEDINKYLPNHFIFYKPKDIISGDFYWFKDTGYKIIVAEIDCTGHGVPGAIMSMIGYTALNEAVNEYNYLSPSKILMHVHKYVINALQQTKDASVNDGMDMTLCVLDTDASHLQVSAAKQEMIIIRNNEIMSFKGDPWSIGDEIPDDESFSQHEIILENNDQVFLFSDGFQDQFGGENDKKFTKKRFKSLLQSIAHKNAEEQNQILAHDFYEWKGKQLQIDDVTVFGFKFND